MMPLVRTIAAFCFSALLLYGISSNLVLAAVFINGRKVFNSIPFYIIAYQMIVCDFFIYIAQAVVVIPSLLLDAKAAAQYTSWQHHSLLASFDSIGSYAALHFTFLIVCNRLAVFLSPKISALFINRRILFVWILFTWLFSIALTVFEYFTCPKTFNAVGIYLYYGCEKNCSSIGLQKAFTHSITVWGYLLPAVMFVCYVYIFICVKRVRQTSLPKLSTTTERSVIQDSGTLRNARKSISMALKIRFSKKDPEVSTIMQAGLICGILELQTLIFFLFPIFSRCLPPKYGVYLNIVQNCTIILSNSMGPLIFYCFNSEIKMRAERILHCQKTRKISTVGCAR
ncbi:hypothetical protein Tcan_12151 [Toxocara canis]|uniref:G-protein coupled receptors family 1 profile domain-containing protein n=1 Tax=Toxocara canis TaxID=6265 RepID=A0A0B2USX5_TOXCA|nr:hypothetical protein Tcan_12151 [Toxocara canis]